MKFSDAFLNFSNVATAAQLDIYPADVVVKNKPNAYGLVHFIPSGTGANSNSLSGVVIVDIVVLAGNGPALAHAFADRLDEYLVKKAVNGTQFFTSSLVPRGALSSDPTRTRYEYTISFKHFGVE